MLSHDIMYGIDPCSVSEYNIISTVANLVAACKELSAEVNSLQNEINELKSQLASEYKSE